MILFISGMGLWSQVVQATDDSPLKESKQPPIVSTKDTGVIVEGTRMIYDENRKENSIVVRNNSDGPSFIKSWIDSNVISGKENIANKAPFELIPSLYKLEAGGQYAIKVTHKGQNLPIDRESLFWINIKSVPEKINIQKNALVVSLIQRLKLFYRPFGIKEPTEMDYNQLKFSIERNKILVNNPTPYWLTFYAFNIDGVRIDHQGVMVPPKGKAQYTLPHQISGGKVTWQIINDYGGNSLVHNNVIHE